VLVRESSSRRPPLLPYEQVDQAIAAPTTPGSACARRCGVGDDELAGTVPDSCPPERSGPMRTVMGAMDHLDHGGMGRFGDRDRIGVEGMAAFTGPGCNAAAPCDRPAVASPLMPLVVGVDSSTQSTRSSSVNLATGQVVRRRKRPAIRITVPPRSEQHPADWWDALVAATATAFLMAADAHTRRRGCGSVCRTTARPEIVLDHHHQVLRRPGLWNDTDRQTMRGLLVDLLGEAQWAAAAAASLPPPSRSPTPGCRRCEPDTFALWRGAAPARLVDLPPHRRPW